MDYRRIGFFNIQFSFIEHATPLTCMYGPLAT